MTNSNWRLHARQVIHQAIQDAMQQGLDADATLKLIDSRYPFGARQMHPYQMWLIERKIARQRIGKAMGKAGFDCRFCQDAGCVVCGAKAGTVPVQAGGEG